MPLEVPTSSPSGVSLAEYLESTFKQKDQNATAHLSASSITLFKRCPRQWQQKYIFGLRDSPSSSLVVGKAVHLGLSKALSGGSPDGIWEEVLADSGEDIDWSRMSEKEAIKLSQKHIENYQRLVAPYLGEVVATEKSLEILFPGVEIPVIGFVDLETTSKVIDYKSTNYFNRKPSLNPEWAFQLAIYQYAIPKAGEIHVLTRGDKYPVYVPNSYDDPLYREAPDLVKNTKLQGMVWDAWQLMNHYWETYKLRPWPGNETQDWGHKYCKVSNCCAIEKW